MHDLLQSCIFAEKYIAMWKDLTMQQRAELMDIYLQHGITSLDDIRRDYDLQSSDTVTAYPEDTNDYAHGGSIYIKPSHRGRFTRLKERTGHSASWFKEHGTPAQKKMATFALNAAKWKHGYGGNLYGDGGPESKGGLFDYLNRAFDQYKNLRKNVNRKLRLEDNGYIGGSSKETRQKYFDTDKEFTDSVISISERYGLNPNLTASRIAREGPIDMAINMYNGYTDYPKGSIWSEERVETKGPEWGLDDLGSNIKGGNVNITTSAPYSWKDAESTNKHGRLTNTIESPQWWFGIEGTAAELKARRDKLKKNNPWMDESTLDEAASMSYNHGEKGAQDYIDKHHRVKPGFKPFIKIK